MAANSKLVFFARKNSEVEPIGLHFGPLVGRTMAHIHDVGSRLLFRVTREIVLFQRNFGFFSCESGPRYSCQNFIPMGLGGPRMAHSKIWTSPLRFLKNLGKTFLGVGRPGGLAPKFKGSPRTRYGGIIGGPLDVQNTVGTGALGQTLGTEVSRKSENFEILGSGSVLGAL